MSDGMISENIKAPSSETRIANYFFKTFLVSSKEW